MTARALTEQRTARAVSARLRRARIEAGLSQHELAASLDISRGTVAHVEMGRYSPSLDMATQWAWACGFEFAWTVNKVVSP